MDILRYFECYNIQCAIVKFKGVMLMPLNHCPQCQNPGRLILEEEEKVD